MGQGLLDGVFAGKEGVAKTLANLLGGSGVLNTPGDVSYSPLSGEETAGEGSSDDVDVSGPKAYKLESIDGTNILKGDCEASVPACDVSKDPIPNKSTLTIGETLWRVVGVLPVYSGSEIATYKLQLRK